VENVAEPEERETTPRVAAPSRKITVPVGTPAPGERTEREAVSVRGCPKMSVPEVESEAEVWARLTD
jgi:hypothetical protein